MSLVRRGVVHIVSLLLLLALIVGVVALSFRLALNKPAQVETWLGQNGFYTALATNTIDRAEQASSSLGGSSATVSFNDPTILKIARQTLSPQVLQRDVDTVLKSNYAWLGGKTATPDFSIDVSGLRQNFANQVGQAVQAHLADLPACSLAQLSQLQGASLDLLNSPCLPSTLDAQAVASEITGDINTNSTYLSNPTITASSLDPNQTTQSKPYYKDLSWAPQVYKWSLRLPWICAVLAALSVLGIVWLSPRKKSALRRVAITFLLAGILLLLTKIAADAFFKAVRHSVANIHDIGSLEHSLTGFLQTVEQHVVKIDLWSGVAYLVIAAVGVSALLVTRQRAPKPVPVARNTEVAPIGERGPPKKLSANDFRARNPHQNRPKTDRPQRPKPPRLIQ